MATLIGPDAGVAWIDFLVRQGLVNASNEPRYAELCCSLRQSSLVAGF